MQVYLMGLFSYFRFLTDNEVMNSQRKICASRKFDCLVLNMTYLALFVFLCNPLSTTTVLFDNV